MHEMSIAESVLDAVRAESARYNGARVTKVGLRIGDLSGVEASSLSFCLEVLAEGIEFDMQSAPGAELNFSYMEIADESAAGTQNPE